MKKFTVKDFMITYEDYFRIHEDEFVESIKKTLAQGRVYANNEPFASALLMRVVGGIMEKEGDIPPETIYMTSYIPRFESYPTNDTIVEQLPPDKLPSEEEIRRCLRLAVKNEEYILASVWQTYTTGDCGVDHGNMLKWEANAPEKVDDFLNLVKKGQSDGWSFISFYLWYYDEKKKIKEVEKFISSYRKYFEGILVGNYYRARTGHMGTYAFWRLKEKLPPPVDKAFRDMLRNADDSWIQEALAQGVPTNYLLIEENLENRNPLEVEPLIDYHLADNKQFIDIDQRNYIDKERAYKEEKKKVSNEQQETDNPEP